MDTRGSWRVNKGDAILQKQLQTIQFDDKRRVLKWKTLD